MAHHDPCHLVETAVFVNSSTGIVLFIHFYAFETHFRDKF